jgi:hypothetical protein
MQQVSTSVRIKPDDDPCFLAALERDRVLPPAVTGRRCAAVSIENLERREMNVDRVEQADDDVRLGMTARSCGASLLFDLAGP